jgi:ArsR family transcriptional regulator, arsenate/arsenite/antimonite-responsive transcriptional repressor
MNPETFAALAHELRLAVFRLLLEHTPNGLPAGQIALRLQVPASTLSTHLGQLERAGLLKSWREQQRILYAVDTEGTRSLVAFLVDDCCGGQPELCGYTSGGKDGSLEDGARARKQRKPRKRSAHGR